MMPVVTCGSDLTHKTLTEIIKDRGSNDEKGITFITDKEDSFFSYKHLYFDSLKILKVLQKKGLSPKCEVIFYLNDPKFFLMMFWACILGGFIPVPIAVRNSYEHKMKIFNVWRILQDKYLVITDDILSKLDEFANENNITELIEEVKSRTINFSQLEFIDEEDGEIYDSQPSDTAYIQFSSGTTGDPKGVILSHENLLTNIKGVIMDAQFNSGESMLSWMPLTHDMGLIGFHLVPMTREMNQYLIPPILFIMRPMIWLKKISQYSANIISGPNFAYKHLLKYFQPQMATGWDLSSIRLIFNGAEPISSALCEEFINIFSAYGLKRDSMYPVYGLAEASLAVSFPSLDDKFIHFTVDRNFLEPGKPVKEVKKTHSRAITFVEVGSAVTGTQIRIIDKNTPLLNNEVGILQIRGKNVTKGYYGNPEATKQVISKDGWLDTGDLAFMRRGKLVVIGRTKDVIFVNGQNYYSHDLERIAEELDTIATGQVVIVGIPDGKFMQDKIVVFVKKKNVTFEIFIDLAISLCRILRLKIGLGLEISQVIPIPRIPKTTSGKVQRNKLKQKFQDGKYNVFIREFEEFIDSTQENSNQAQLRAEATRESEKMDESVNLAYGSQGEKNEFLIKKIQQNLIKMTAEFLKLKEDDIDPNKDMSEYGFDSMAYMKFCEKLNEKYNIDITPPIFFRLNKPTINGLTLFLREEYEPVFTQFYGYDTKTTTDQNENSHDKMATGDIEKKDTRIETIIENINNKLHDSVAIIGMGCVMPGSDTLDQFWKNLESGKNLVTKIPSDRWNWETLSANGLVDALNTSGAKWGGFMREIDKFDPLFFGISPREAELMDPQQRLFLEIVWKTLEDAGHKASDFSGTRTGVFVGVASSDYSEIVKNNITVPQPHSLTGIAHSITANRISYFLNLRGPSEPVDTACSSSLVAIHRAVKAIENKDCEMAIAGGVNVIINPFLNIAFNAAGMLCADGRCKTFDSKANGYVRGEGVGAVLLKPLSKAENDGDHIYAVIRGTAVNHGGRANSLTAPNENAQAEMLINAYEKAAIDPTTITYIETHGTGTKLGDPVEVNGLKKAFKVLYAKTGKSRGNEAHCGIGSVKTNIGHLETAAGIASVIKVLLSMKHKKLPSLLHFNELNPYIELKDSPFYIVNETIPWSRLKDKNSKPIPRRAGISSFGFGGTNAHIILEEYEEKIQEKKRRTGPQIVILSAKDEDRLKEYAGYMADSLEEKISDPENGISLHDIAYTLQIGREEKEERLAVITETVEGLIIKLRRYAEGKQDADNIYRGRVEENGNNMDFLNRDDDVAQIINNWIHRNKLSNIVQFWLSGVRIDWCLLYMGEKCKRVSLPVYPFARERFWVDECFYNKTEDKKNSVCEILHPLIDSNESTFDEQTYKKRFTKKDSYFKDHIVGNTMVLPGVVHLEMARASGDLAYKNSSVTKIKNIAWLHPAVMDQDNLDVHIRLFLDENSANYEVYTIIDNDEISIHSHGLLVYGKSKPVADGMIDLDSIRERCGECSTGIECYNQFETAGLNYGYSFRSIKEIFYNDRESLAHLELPVECKNFFGEFWLHPSIMDGAFQMLISLLGDIDNNASKSLYLPFAIEEVELCGPLCESCYAYAEKKGDPGSRLKKFHISLVDESGKVLVLLKDFSLMEIDHNNKFLKYERREKVKHLLQKMVLGDLHIDEVDRYTKEVYLYE